MENKDMVDFLSLDNFVEVCGHTGNYVNIYHYIDVRYISIIKMHDNTNYSIYVDKQWIYSLGEEDITKIFNMRKAIDRDGKINSVIND